MPALPLLIVGILLWVLGHGVWVTVGIVLTLVSGGLFAVFALFALFIGATAFAAFKKF